MATSSRARLARIRRRRCRSVALVAIAVAMLALFWLACLFGEVADVPASRSVPRRGPLFHLDEAREFHDMLEGMIP